jgi:hypothetical protein
MGKSSAPPPPDYTAAANATAAGNLQMAQYATEANRVNQNNPNGSLSWTRGTNADGTPNNQWTQNTTLSEGNQALYDQQMRTSQTLAGLQNPAVNRYAQTVQGGWDDTALAAAGIHVPQSQRTAAYQTGGQPTAPSTGGQGSVVPQQSSFGSYPGTGNNPPGSGSTANPPNPSAATPGAGVDSSQRVDFYDASRVGEQGRVYDATADTDSGTRALMARINPQLERKRAATEAQLANQGITRGSEAWTNAQNDLSMAENDAYSQAGLQGIQTGMAQQAQTYGQQTNNRAALTADQKLLADQQLAVRGQQSDYNGKIGAANIGASATTTAASMAAGASERNAQLGYSLGNRQQTIAEQQYFANRDLQQLNNIRAGSSPQMPTFGSYAQQQTTQGADQVGAVTSGYNSAVAANNANNANAANTFSGAVGVASMFF